jgi:hypothetical protein
MSVGSAQDGQLHSQDFVVGVRLQRLTRSSAFLH